MNMKKKLIVFLGITFILPLVCCLIMQSFPIFRTGAANLILYAIEGASPTIAAIVVHCRGKEKGIGAFLSDKLWKQFSVKYCLIGFFTPAIVLTLGKAIVYFTMGTNEFFSPLSVKKILIISWALVAEELGWRGFLQDWLQEQCREVWIPLITGVIWALWHYHFVISGTMDIPYVAFLFGCVAESYGYYLITKASKGNVVPACIWHFSGNLFFNIYHINPEWNGGSMIPYWIINGIYLVYFLMFMLYQREEKE